ncbi:PIN2/TERF1-interacting telomerase inhibitor 1 [Strongyloides ratti]|uniref:PIN2/TERF1-interacting telomerase inhibitor 1 n=1 Tax=Strongyloides ratti TaxID=34506 RepID=A0A090L620_STRRB|nr:PIN2/TERF1-interacting telomerase inhibitor 1 [Strongyloides ratti]CEF65162.1 PIN2/TERF1-interacting telomerase inhibitor 1 [Strongyloides ratti]
MSILAERKRKQKIPNDPNNLKWQNSEDSVAKKLLAKMGWKEGKGLGKDEQGNVDGLKVKSNHTQKGLGCDGVNDKAWVGHHDDFASILANLNKNKKGKIKNEEESSDEEEHEKNKDNKSKDNVLNLEERARISKRRIHYQKFIKRKDLSQATDADKLQIFGKSNVKKENDEMVEKVEVEEKEEEIVSSINVNDYFAAKLAAFNAKRTELQLSEKNNIKEEEIEEESIEKPKKKKAKKIKEENFNC